MTYFSQLQAVTGKRKRKSDLAQINAQAELLPDIYDAAEAKDAAAGTRDYENKMFGLREKEFAHTKDMNEEQQFLANRAQEKAEKDAKTGRAIQMANIGLTTAQNAGWLEPIGKGVSTVGKKIWGGAKSAFGGIGSAISSMFGLV